MASVDGVDAVTISVTARTPGSVAPSTLSMIWYSSPSYFGMLAFTAAVTLSTVNAQFTSVIPCLSAGSRKSTPAA